MDIRISMEEIYIKRDREKYLELRRQVKAMTHKHPVIPEVKLVLDNTWVTRERDKEFEWILVEHEQYKEWHDQGNRTQDNFD